MTVTSFFLAGCAATERYPFSPEMALLEKDAASTEYARSLRPLIPNDLSYEWQRVDVPDGAGPFFERHGGEPAVRADDELRAAWERRKVIESDFLETIRAEYRRRNLEAPFDRGAKPDRFAPAAPRAKKAAPAAIAVAPIPPCERAEQNWPRWRGPGGQGTSAARGLPAVFGGGDGKAGNDGNPPGLLWKTPLPGSGNSSPIIWDARIYLTAAFEAGRRRSLICMDREKGRILWVKDAPAAPPEPQVRDKNGYASATPATDGERVLAFFGSAGLVSFHPGDGGILWHQPIDPFGGLHGTAASPVLYQDLVILFQDQNVRKSVSVALDKRTGAERWRIDREPILGWCTPVVLRAGGRDELIHGSNRRLTAYDPATGKELWRCGGPTDEVIPTIVCGGGLIFATSGRNGPTLAIRPGGSGDVTATHLLWSVSRGGPHVPSPVLVNGSLTLINDFGFATCLDAPTGATRWQKRLGGRFSASPLAADGKIYFANEDGVVTVMKDDGSGEILATNELDAPVLASPAVLEGRLYFRTATHLLAIGAEPESGTRQVGAFKSARPPP